MNAPIRNLATAASDVASTMFPSPIMTMLSTTSYETPNAGARIMIRMSKTAAAIVLEAPPITRNLNSEGCTAGVNYTTAPHAIVR